MKLTYVTEEQKLETLNDLGDPEKRNREPKSLCRLRKKKKK